MENLNLLDLEKCFKNAIEANVRYIGVLISTEGSKGAETIINPRVNFENKLEYYKKAYNDNLTLKSFNGIKIINFTSGNSYDDIDNYFNVDPYNHIIIDNYEEDKELIFSIFEKLKIRKDYSDYKNLESIDFVEVDGIKYGIKEIESLDTLDEGKYQYGGTIYAIGFLNETKGYDIVGLPIFYVAQMFSQTGSYYSEQERTYDAPDIVFKKKTIKEVWV